MEKTIVKTEKYDELKLEMLKKFLESRAIKGSARYYEIYVDNLKVVEKTNKVEDFDGYEGFLYDGVKEITIQIYTSSEKSPRPISRHVFTLDNENEEPKKSETLQGTDELIDKKISEKVSMERERWDSEQVKKDLEETKKKLKEAESYIDILTGKLEEKGKKGEIADLGSTLIKDVLPQFLGSKKAENTGLSGSSEKGETTFSKKTQAEPPSLSEEDQQRLEFIRALEEKFDEQQMETVMQIVNALGGDTGNINTVASLLNIKPKQESQK